MDVPAKRTRYCYNPNPASSQLNLDTLTSRQLAISTATDEQAIDFAIRLGLISRISGNCPQCQNIMELYKDSGEKTQIRFRCICKKSLSMLTNTFFENSKLPIWKILALIYSFCNFDKVTKAAVQCEVDDEYACKWFKRMRDVQENIISNLGETNIIGGNDHVVEIDEFHLYTPKYNKGRIPSKGATWGFGGIDVNTRDIFVVPVIQRTKAVLLPLIRQYVNPGTTIFSDMWPSYTNLEKDLKDMKIFHRSVNHKKEFVNSEEPSVHTQTIERLWKSFRELVPKTTKMEMIESYFASFLYFVKYEWISKHPGNRFRLLCQHISEVYPGPFKISKI
jgi:transposase-like protein